MDKSEYYCNNPIESMIKIYPELNYWNEKCLYKVINLQYDDNLWDSTNDDNGKIIHNACECRYLNLTITDSDFDKYNFSYEHVNHVLEQWTMLERFQFNVTTTVKNALSSNVDLNLTQSRLGAKNMKILIFYRIRVTMLDDKIGDMTNLEILQITDHLVEDIPWKSLGKLKQLKLFDMGESTTYDKNVTSDICNWNELRYFRMSYTQISSLPDCISNDWQQVRRIDIKLTPMIQYPPKLFSLPNLITFAAEFNHIGYENGLILDNNGDNHGYGWSSSLYRVYLQQSSSVEDGICNNIGNITDNMTLEFLNYFGACYQECNISYDCLSDYLGDGVCDDGCNNEECLYDIMIVTNFVIVIQVCGLIIFVI